MLLMLPPLVGQAPRITVAQYNELISSSYANQFHETLVGLASCSH